MNHFTRFNLPCDFALNIEALEKTYQQLQRLTHPDRFVTASAAEQRIALQQTSLINQAYEILRHPLSRAQYLCELQNIRFDNNNQPKLSPTFLAQQWEWREKLENLAQVDHQSAQQQRQTLLNELTHTTQQIAQRFAKHYQDNNFAEAAICVQEWKFIEKFSEQLNTNAPSL